MELIDHVKYRHDYAGTRQHFWKEKLESSDGVFFFSQKASTASERDSTELSSFHFQLDAGLSAGIKALAKNNQAALLTFYLSAFSVLLQRYGQANPVIIDTPAYKSASAGNVPMVIEVQDDLRFREFLNMVNLTVRDSYKFQDFPLQSIREDAKLETNLLFCFRDFHGACTNQNGYDLVLEFKSEDDMFSFDVHFNEEQFERDFIERFFGHYRRLLTHALQSHVHVRELEILGEDELQMIKAFSRGPQVHFEGSALMHGLVQMQAQLHPEQPAIVFNNRTITYHELVVQSGRLQRYLHESGSGGPGKKIGIFIDRSEFLVISILGVLRSGAAYVPINTSLPKERVAYILQDAGIDMLLTESKYLFNFEYFSGSLFAADIQLADLPETTGNEVADFAPGDPAYVIYTSGSTGVPKGVVVAHESIRNTILWRNSYYGFSIDDRILQVPAISFDSSVEDVFCALTSGATLIMMEEEARKGVPYICTLVQEQGVTNFLVTPSLYAVLLDHLTGRSNSLRIITIAGEAVSPALVEKHFSLLPQVALINEYGPTENAVCSTVKKLQSGEPVTIGKPVSNVSLYILDKSMQPSPVGAPGEIYLGGAGLNTYYLNNAALNQAAYVPNPFEKGARLYKTGDFAFFLPDGDIKFLGRKDEQVKLNGIRIELEEIEAIVKQCRGVQDCRVLHVPQSNTLKCIVKVDKTQEEILFRLAKQARERPGLLQHSRLLPNGMLVHHKNNAETDLTYQEIFLDQLYNKYGIELGPQSIVFDVGANIGMFTLFAGIHLPGSTIYSFEPIAPVFESMSLNAKLYNVHAHVFNFGFSDVAGEAEMVYYYNNTASSGLYADVDKERNVGKAVLRNSKKYAALSNAQIEELVDEGARYSRHQCRLETLAGFMSVHQVDRIDLLKLDVEKSELNVLRGLDKAGWQKIRQIVAEVHDMADNIAQVEGLLHENGFSFVRDQPEFLQSTDIHYIYARRDGISETSQQEKIPIATFNNGENFTDLSTFSQYILSACSRQLPPFMIPNACAIMDEFPLTINGKLDIKAIHQRLELEEQAAQRVLDAPRTPMEQLLAATWCKVIGKERIGIHENFFQAGGDSIKAIQIAANMYREGFKIEVKDIFELPTIALLAPAAVPVKKLAPQSMVTGEIPLTPIQREYFPPGKIDPHHFNQSLLLYSRNRLDIGMVKTAVNRLHEHHDALRIVLKKENDGWRQINKGEDFETSVEEYFLDNTLDLERIASAAQAGINLETGPLMKTLLFHLDDGDRLLFIIHHLVIDGVSWRILLEDIGSLFRLYKHNEDLVLPLKTDSFKQWSEGLLEYATSDLLRGEMAYWERVHSQAGDSLPFEETGLQEGHAFSNYASIDFSLDEEQTKLLLGPANQPFNTQINDLLLSALGLALHEVFGTQNILVDMEGHGRENILSGLDVSRTIGWFTSVYPVALPGESPGGLAGHIMHVKETLRNVPSRGIGYGILKYLAPGTGFNNLPSHAQVSFNYLGQFDEDFDNSELTPAGEPTGENFSLADHCKYELNCSGLVSGKELSMSIHYNRGHFKAETMTAFANAWQRHLQEVTSFCCHHTQRELTPSDLSVKGVSQESLDRIKSMFS
jgi:amino acid adenylation domain-containing protein/non-ribosomal peptide synthase protein (TIGR01720 family)/FkbM family methyltransferase